MIIKKYFEDWDVALNGKCHKCNTSPDCTIDDYLPRQLCNKHLLLEYQRVNKESKSKRIKIIEVEWKLDGYIKQEKDKEYFMINKFLLAVYKNEIQKRKLVL